MSPVLTELLGGPLYGYWFFYGLGMLVAVWIASHLALRRNLDFWKVWWMLLLSVLGAFAGARIGYILFDPGFVEYGDLSKGGEVSFGGLAGGLLAALIWAFFRKLPIPDVLDIAAPSIILGEGVQRIGCFCNGCCYGPVADTSISVRFPKFLTPSGDIGGTPCFLQQMEAGLVKPWEAESLPVIPMQLIWMAICLSITGICLWLFYKNKFRGSLLYLAFVLYGSLRFIVQWFRPNYDLRQEQYAWNMGHTACLIMVLLGGSVLLLRWRFGPDWAGFEAARAEKAKMRAMKKEARKKR
ncbi:MAG: prolipoprotein diacylglyceryl transferase [Planctomycetota bacterium]